MKLEEVVLKGSLFAVLRPGAKEAEAEKGNRSGAVTRGLRGDLSVLVVGWAQLFIFGLKGNPEKDAKGHSMKS